MKATAGFIVTAALAAALAAPGAAFSQPAAPQIAVYVNGQALDFDVPPTVIQGRVFVPLRGIFESMGATVEYNPATQQIYATDGQQNVQLTVGSRQALVDGVPEMLDVPAFTIGGRTMVPLRFIGEGLGAQVRWIAERNAILITNGRTTAIPMNVPGNRPAASPVPPPQASSPAPETRTVSGRLMAVVVGANSSIVLRSGGQDVTIPVMADTAIYRYDAQSNAGGSAALGALHSGDMVVVRINDAGQATRVTATYSAALGGRIAAVNGRSVRLANGQSYVVLPDARITLNGQSAGFDAVRRDREARFYLIQGTDEAYEVHVTVPASASMRIPIGLSAPGISAPDNHATVGNTIVVTGRAQPGAMVVVTAEPRLLGQTVQGTTQARDDGTWTVSLNVQSLPRVAFPYILTATQIVNGVQSDPTTVEVTIR